MPETFAIFTGLDKLFVFCAVAGAVVFISRVILQLIGHHGDAGDVGGADGHFDVGHDVAHDAGGGDSDASFKLITFHGVAAFFLMFGLVGLALSRQTKVQEIWAILGALLAGEGALFVIGKIYQVMGRLQSSGTLDLRNAIGQEGTVYLRITPGGTGKTQVCVQEHLKVLDAVTRGAEELRTGDRVRVVDLTGGNILVVEKVKEPAAAAN
jgi:hypothetical protein